MAAVSGMQLLAEANRWKREMYEVKYDEGYRNPSDSLDTGEKFLAVGMCTDRTLPLLNGSTTTSVVNLYILRTACHVMTLDPSFVGPMVQL